MWMVDLEGEKEFDYGVNKRKVQAEDTKMLENFIAYFAKLDRQVRRKIKDSSKSGGTTAQQTQEKRPRTLRSRHAAQDASGSYSPPPHSLCASRRLLASVRPLRSLLECQLRWQ